jgi:hypothetical protein
MGPSLRTATSFPYGAGCGTLEAYPLGCRALRRARPLTPLCMLTLSIVHDASSDP